MVYYKISGDARGDAIRGGESRISRISRISKKSKKSIASPSNDLSRIYPPEIFVTDRRRSHFLVSLSFLLNYRYSEAVSELASDYSGCSLLIVSATLPADREESFPSGTVALDHELTETFGEEGVYRRTTCGKLRL